MNIVRIPSVETSGTLYILTVLRQAASLLWKQYRPSNIFSCLVLGDRQQAGRFRVTSWGARRMRL